MLEWLLGNKRKECVFLKKSQEMSVRRGVEYHESIYNGSFARLICDYMRFTGMTRQEVERILEELRKANGM